ncbi:MAG: SLBB domain-containing protein [Hyphomicrobiales bacterium]
MKQTKHHILRLVLAVVLVCVSLPVMFDVFTQKSGIASETVPAPGGYSADNLGSLSIAGTRWQAAEQTIDFTTTSSTNKALNELAKRRAEQTKSQAETQAAKSATSGNEELDEVDRMLAEIDSVLNEIESISGSKDSADKLPVLAPDSQATASARPTFFEPNAQRPAVTSAQKSDDRITTSAPAQTGKNLIETLNAEMTKVISEKADKEADRIPMSEREKAQKMLDRITEENTDASVSSLPVLKDSSNEAETIVVGKSKNKTPLTEVAANSTLQESLLKLARSKGHNAVEQESGELAAQLRALQKDIRREKKTATTPEPTTLASAPTALQRLFGQDDENFVEKINAGDVLSLTLPGEDSLTADFEVNRDGSITLPEIGSVKVSNLTLVEANEVIQKQLSEVYRNLDRLSIEIKERKLIVNVLGFVKNPGQVSLPADSNVQTAISKAGGLSVGAQLDRMQVRRGEEVFTFNYKNYLNSGNLRILPPLKPLDTIFVPASPLTGAVELPFNAETLASQGDGGDDGTGIRIFGEVRTPTTMAFKKDLTLIDAVMRAGGLTGHASVKNIRVVTKDGSEIVDLKAVIDEGRLFDLSTLEEGSTIFVPKQDKELKVGGSVIYVMGEVVKPGAFETRGETNFIDILANAGGPTRHGETRNIRVIRKGNAEIVMVDLPAFTEGRINTLPTLLPGDTIFIPEKADNTAPSWLKIPSERAVQVLGAMKKPGRYEWADEMSFFDLIAAAGGPTKDADLAKIKILEKKADGTVNATFFNMSEFVEKGGSTADLPQIRAGYVVIFQSNEGETAGSESTIKVFGEVQTPGNVEFLEGETLIDVLLQTGGVTSEASVDRIRVLSGGKPVYVNLQEYLDTGDITLLPNLKPGATIFVPRAIEGQNGKSGQTVFVMGEVNKPGGYEVQGEIGFIDIVAGAGGPSRFADTKGIRIIRADGSVTNVDLPSFTEGRGGVLPPIYPGDTVFFPRASDDPDRPSWLKIAPNRAVELFGAVVRPDRYEWSDEMSLFDLMAQAGGPTKEADMRRIQVVSRINGIAKTQVFDMQSFIENGGNEADIPVITAGSTVNIPFLTEDPNRPSWLEIGSDHAVEVIGAVARPDRYEWSDEMTFFDLIAQAGGPSQRADMSNVQILVKKNGRTVPTTFNMEKFIKEGGAIADLPQIRAGYVINMPYLPDDPTGNKSAWIKQAPEDSIYVFGQVGTAGRYAFSEHLSFIDIISAADGPTNDADLRNIRVSHRNRGEAGISKVNLSLYFETGDEALLPHVVPGDVIYVPSREREWLDVSKEQTVRVLGSVGSPGRYRFDDNMTILDLLAEAGGPTNSALQKKIVVVNLSKSKDQARTFNLIKFAKTGDISMLPVVRAGDTVYVPDTSQTIWKKIQSGVAGTSGLLTFALALIAL